MPNDIEGSSAAGGQGKAIPHPGSLQALVDTASGSMLATLLLDGEHRVLALSDAALAMYGGRTSEEVVGSRLEDFAPRGKMAGEIAAFNEVIETGEDVYAASITGADGRVRRFARLITPDVIPGGAHLCFIFDSPLMMNAIFDPEDAASLVSVAVAAPEGIACALMAQGIASIGLAAVSASCAEYGHINAMLLAHRPEVLAISSSPFESDSGRRTDDEEFLAAIAQSATFIEENKLEARILAIHHQETIEIAREALALGAAGFVGPSQGPGALTEAIRALSLQSVYINPALAMKIARARDDLASGLTPRQAEIARLLALGYTNKEVAEELYLSVRTVEAHHAAINDFIGSRSRRDLVAFAIESELIP